MERIAAQDDPQGCKVSLNEKLTTILSSLERIGKKYKFMIMEKELNIAAILIVLPYNDQTARLIGTTDEWEGGEV